MAAPRPVPWLGRTSGQRCRRQSIRADRGIAFRKSRTRSHRSHAGCYSDQPRHQDPTDRGHPGLDVSRLVRGESPICFAAGTRIATPEGDRMVEQLRPGDRVLTSGGAVLPVLWVGGRRLSGGVLRANPKWAPIRIEPGALAPGVPARPLTVSPQHRILLTGERVAHRLRHRAVFVPARGLLGLPGVAVLRPEDGIAYHHLLLPRHAALRADGAPAESLLPTGRSLASLSPADRATVAALVVRHGLADTTRLPCLTTGQARRALCPSGAAQRSRAPA
ncbi:MAG: Hint domain-containing protein [Rhodobacteraceae bacterium]|nr:Hint domain-containing protein [Paracoccaceae bacterium]